MASTTKKQTADKGQQLELRVARLLFAEGLSPFVNVYYRTELEPSSVTSPDIDVMGCSFLADGTVFYTHFDCKSGESELVSRILMLMGLRSRIPPGPITYIRKHAPLDVKRYALHHGIRISSLTQLDEREQSLVLPLFGDAFPSISDFRAHALWTNLRTQAKSSQLGRILRYLDSEFWSETPFTRLRRTIAATELIQSACSETGIPVDNHNILVGLVVRRVLFSLLAASSYAAYISSRELQEILGEWLVSEKLPLREYQTLVEGAAQLIYQIYGDPNKGPLRSSDYYVPPPSYVEELASLISQTVGLYGALPLALTAFDALVVEEGLFGRRAVSQALMHGASASQVEKLQIWLRSVRLFLAARQPSLGDWRGWSRIG